MGSTRSEASRQLGITTPLGDDVLLVRSFRLSESLGRMPHLELDLLSESADLAFEELIGQNVTVRLEAGDGSFRSYNGFISRFTQSGHGGRTCHYRATVVPWLWFLTRTTDCRIFQSMTVPDIIKSVFADHGLDAFDDRLSESYSDWVYCVQYGETDFDFVSRLMEQEGIYYYFEHDEGEHTMVLADGPVGHAPSPGHEEISYQPPTAQFREKEHITLWTVDKQLWPGSYVLNDFDFTAPRKPLEVRSQRPRGHVLAEYEQYEYPGEYAEFSEGERYARTRIEAMQCMYEVIVAETNVRRLHVGHRFKLVDHPRSDQAREYLVIAVESEAVNDAFDSAVDHDDDATLTFQSKLHVIPATESFRLERRTPKPRIRGPQTAIVAGPEGEEIWTDQYGRIKVQFHWDRYGKSDQKSSCWIRVAQIWAGAQWGAMAIPRIGQEVVVEFMEGDPDRPIVTGSVYNGDHMPPYGLPDNKTQTGIKSRSSKEGRGDNYNEIRFEDKKDDELLTIHAEKDESITVENDKTEDVGHDETITIGNDRTETVGHDETITVENDRTETVVGNETLTVEKDRTRTVNKNESVTVTLTRTHSVGINEAINIGAAQEVTVGAMQVVTVGANQTMAVGINRATSVGKNDTLDVGKKLVVEAGEEITLKTGKSKIVMKKDGTITIQGKDISIKGTGKIDVKATKNVTIKGKKILEN